MINSTIRQLKIQKSSTKRPETPEPQVGQPARHKTESDSNGGAKTDPKTRRQLDLVDAEEKLEESITKAYMLTESSGGRNQLFDPHGLGKSSKHFESIAKFGQRRPRRGKMGNSGRIQRRMKKRQNFGNKRKSPKIRSERFKQSPISNLRNGKNGQKVKTQSKTKSPKIRHPRVKQPKKQIRALSNNPFCTLNTHKSQKQLSKSPKKEKSKNNKKNQNRGKYHLQTLKIETKTHRPTQAHLKSRPQHQRTTSMSSIQKKPEKVFSNTSMLAAARMSTSTRYGGKFNFPMLEMIKLKVKKLPMNTNSSIRNLNKLGESTRLRRAEKEKIMKLLGFAPGSVNVSITEGFQGVGGGNQVIGSVFGGSCVDWSEIDDQYADENAFKAKKRPSGSLGAEKVGNQNFVNQSIPTEFSSSKGFKLIKHRQPSELLTSGEVSVAGNFEKNEKSENFFQPKETDFRDNGALPGASIDITHGKGLDFRCLSPRIHQEMDENGLKKKVTSRAFSNSLAIYQKRKRAMEQLEESKKAESSSKNSKKQFMVKNSLKYKKSSKSLAFNLKSYRRKYPDSEKPKNAPGNQTKWNFQKMVSPAKRKLDFAKNPQKVFLCRRITLKNWPMVGENLSTTKSRRSFNKVRKFNFPTHDFRFSHRGYEQAYGRPGYQRSKPVDENHLKEVRKETKVGTQFGGWEIPPESDRTTSGFIYGIEEANRHRFGAEKGGGGKEMEVDGFGGLQSGEDLSEGSGEAGGGEQPGRVGDQEEGEEVILADFLKQD